MSLGGLNVILTIPWDSNNLLKYKQFEEKLTLYL